MKAREMRKIDIFENIGQGVEQSVEEMYVYVVFSPANQKSQEYTKILSEGIKALRDFQQILAKYGLQDWK
jgi:hypothetical protein